MKDPSNFLGKSYLTKGEMRKVVMQTPEPASTWEATEWMVKILNITYENEYLKQVADNSRQLNYEEITLFLIPLT